MGDLKLKLLQDNNKDSMSTVEKTLTSNNDDYKQTQLMNASSELTAKYNVCSKGLDLLSKSTMNQLNKLKDDNSNSKMVLAMSLDREKQIESSNNQISDFIKDYKKSMNDNKSSTKDIISSAKTYLTEENVIVGTIATWYTAFLYYLGVIIDADVSNDLSDCSGILVYTKLSIFLICTSLLFYLKYDNLKETIWLEKISKALKKEGDSGDDNDNNILNTNYHNYMSFREFMKLEWWTFMYSFLIWILFSITIDTTIIECAFDSQVQAVSIFGSTVLLVVIFILSKKRKENKEKAQKTTEKMAKLRENKNKNEKEKENEKDSDNKENDESLRDNNDDDDDDGIMGISIGNKIKSKVSEVVTSKYNSNDFELTMFSSSSKTKSKKSKTSSDKTPLLSMSSIKSVTNYQ